MQEVDERIRELCRQILEEQDPSKVEQLLDSLQSTVQGYSEETKWRMSFIANYYRPRLANDLSDTEAIAERGTSIRALLEFLGFGRGARREGEAES
jgi:hypothetical protein